MLVVFEASNQKYFSYETKWQVNEMNMMGVHNLTNCVANLALPLYSNNLPEFLNRNLAFMGNGKGRQRKVLPLPLILKYN